MTRRIENEEATLARLAELTTFDPTTKTFSWRKVRGRRCPLSFGCLEANASGKFRLVASIDNRKYLVSALVELWEARRRAATRDEGRGPTPLFL